MHPDSSTIKIMEKEASLDLIQRYVSAAFSAAVPLVIGSLVWYFIRDPGWLAIALTVSTVYVLVAAIGHVSDTINGSLRWLEMRYISHELANSADPLDEGL